MSGKRENKRRRSRLPGLAALVCVLAVLMSPGPADAAKSPVEGVGVELPAQAARLRNTTVTQLGEDFLLEGEVDADVHGDR